MRRFWATLGFIAAPLGIAPFAYAQTLSLPEAVVFALHHSSAAIVALADTRVATDRAQAARAQGGPRVDVSYGYLFSNNPLEALSAQLERRQVTAQAFAPSALNNPSITRLGTTTLSLVWPLYTGGALRESIKAGRFGEKAGRSAAQRVKQRVIANVVQAYEGLVMAKAAASVAKEGVAAAAHHARTTRYLYAHGRIVHADALAAAVNLGTDTELLAEARGDVTTAAANLGLAMGAPDNLVISIPNGSLTPAALPTRSLPYYLKEALDHRPDLKALRAKAQALEAQVRAARAASSIHVSVMAQSQWFSQTPGLRHNAWTVGAVISKSLYDGHRNQDQGDVLQEQVTAMDAQLTGLKSRIHYHVIEAYDAMRSAARRYGIARKNVARAKREVGLVQIRYGEGRAILLELLSAEQSLVQAREARLAALYSLTSNRTALEAACGTLSVTTLASLGLPS